MTAYLKWLPLSNRDGLIDLAAWARPAGNRDLLDRIRQQQPDLAFLATCVWATVDRTKEAP